MLFAFEDGLFFILLQEVFHNKHIAAVFIMLVEGEWE